MEACIGLLCLAILSCSIQPALPMEAVEKRLTEKILRRYDDLGILGRPVVNSSEVVTVRLGLALIQILDLHENQQLLRTNCWLRFSWHDRLLSWENWTQPEFHQIEQIRLPPSQVWTPDIKLYNFADDRMLERRQARIVVTRSGQVLWIPQALLKTTCKVQIRMFPFDTQICRIRFGSWTYDERHLRLDWALVNVPSAASWSNGSPAASSFDKLEAGLTSKPLPYVDFSDYVISNEWATDGELEVGVPDPDQRVLQIRSQVRYRNESGHDAFGNAVVRRYRLLDYRIRMMRNPSFYVAILVVPCILLSCLTLIVFCLPPEAPAKMLLGMSIFVAFFILLLLLAELIPSAVETFPLIGCYYCVNMVMITVSTFLVSIIVNLHFNNGDTRQPMHPMLKKIMLDTIGCLLQVRSRHSLVLLPPPPPPTPSPTPTPSVSSESANENENDDVEDSTFAAVNAARTRRMEANLSEVARSIRRLLRRGRREDAIDAVAVDWRDLLRTLDRLFFFIYLVLIATFALVFVPRRLDYLHMDHK